MKNRQAKALPRGVYFDQSHLDILFDDYHKEFWFFFQRQYSYLVLSEKQTNLLKIFFTSARFVSWKYKSLLTVLTQEYQAT